MNDSSTATSLRLCVWPNCDCGGAHGIVEDCPKEEGLFCACGNDLLTESEKRDQICRECL